MVFSHLFNFIYMKKSFFAWAIFAGLFFSVLSSCEPDSSDDASILSFKITNLNPEVEAQIDIQNSVIEFVVPYGTDVSALKVEIVLADGATCEPASGSIIDFTQEVDFKVTAEDGSTKQYEAKAEITKADYVYDFESLTLSANSFWAGPDTRVSPETVTLYGTDCQVYYGSFTEKNADFSNTYNSTWFSWSGFAYSNMTDKQTAGYTNQYSVYASTGFESSANFAVAYAPASANPATEIVFETSLSPQKVFINNSTYAYLSMKNGDAYTTAFAEGDYLKLEITGIDELGNTTSTVIAYLADYQNGKSVMLDEWTGVSLSSLGKVKKMIFKLQASQFGVPTYFCLDNLEAMQ